MNAGERPRTRVSTSGRAWTQHQKQWSKLLQFFQLKLKKLAGVSVQIGWKLSLQIFEVGE
jgi:hypothetical protein